MTSEDDIKGLVSLKFLRRWVLPLKKGHVPGQDLRFGLRAAEYEASFFKALRAEDRQEYSVCGIKGRLLPI